MKIYSIKTTLPFSKLAPQTAQKTITDPIYPNRKIFLFIESPELKKQWVYCHGLTKPGGS